jgi:hypothetical protein
MTRTTSLWISLTRVFSLLAISLATGACSKVAFSETGESAVEQSLVDPTDAGSQVGQVDDLCAKGQLQEQDYEISFPNPKKACAWGADGNLEKRSSYFAARTEQVQSFQLPTSGTICKVNFEFTSQDQKFRYDDHFLIAFDKRVIAASYDFGQILDEGLGLLVYDWNKMKGANWGGNNNPLETTFCAGMTEGLSSCSWPKTEQLGTFQLHFDDSLIHRLAALTPGISTHEFRFVTMGDNDESDCQHLDVNFKVHVSYVAK